MKEIAGELNRGEGEPSTVSTTVLIVGAGPAGMTAALALSRYGIPHLLVEKYHGTAHAPRAHIVNQRTVEIMRHLGIERELTAVATPHDQMRNRIWYTTLNKPEVLRQEIWGTAARKNAEYISASPCPMMNCPQTLFEPVLVEALESGGTPVRFGMEFVSVEERDGGYESILRARDTGLETRVRSKFIIGADGARSRIVEAAGLKLEGQTGLYDAVNIWFRADLSKYFDHRPGVLASNVHPGPQPPLGLGTFITCTPFTEFVLVKFYDPAKQDLADLTTDEAQAHIEAAVGEPVPDTQILGVTGWKVNAQVASRFSNGRIFCVGDAVHRHPPSGGMGLNMSVADSFNLAWKIALVERGVAGEELLETYDSERRSVDDLTVQRTVETLQDGVDFTRSLGLEPGMSEQEGWDALSAMQDPGPGGEHRRNQVRQALATADLQVNALGSELGYRYQHGALVLDRSAASSDAGPFTGGRITFTSSTLPGARVAHARIERDQQPLSTLDLLDDLEFALFVGPRKQPWVDAAERLSDEFGIELTVHSIGGDLIDPYWEWADRRGVGPDGAVLVRPDRHVAWRTDDMPADPYQTVRHVLQSILFIAGDEIAAGPKPPANLQSTP